MSQVPSLPDKYVTIPLGPGCAVIPLGLTPADHQLLIDTLHLWERVLCAPLSGAEAVVVESARL